MYASPLRYPGGKSILSPFLSKLFKLNGWKRVVYAEPYAGGAGAAINLLLSDQVDRILINDANLGIYSFWRAICDETDRFCEWILSQPIDLPAWNQWHSLFRQATFPSFELGFATFFLSRTNRSGILNAGPIGGNSIEKQSAAKYKIDCRFNRESLAQRVMHIGERRMQIEVSLFDAIDFLKNHNRDENLFVYLDPPYFEQGKSLYMSYYKTEDHVNLARFLEEEALFNWVMSYDSVEEIKQFYQNFEINEYTIRYSARTARIGTELLTHKPGLLLPESVIVRNQ